MGFLMDLIQGSNAALGGACDMIPNCALVMIGFKIVVLLFLMGWVRNHLGGGIVATVVMLFIGYLVLFQYWYIFGPLAFVYIAAIFGALGLITDVMFAKPHLMPGLDPQMQQGQRLPPP